jgi:uncharacterized membrane protein
MPESSIAPQKAGRIYSMDELRGVAVFCMIFYHGFYTLGFLFGNFAGVFLFRFFTPAEPFFAGLFMFISGIACNLSHSNLSRGLKLFALAMGVTLVTGVFLPEDIITFGILHFLAVCMILAGLLKPVVDRYRFSWVPVAVCAVLYLLTRQVQLGYFGPAAPLAVALPQALYATNWLAPLGFHNNSFLSADYFPILPWIFVYAAGIFVGKLAKAGKFPGCLYASRFPPFSWMGRHALILYLVHQPVIYGVCLLLKPFLP